MNSSPALDATIRMQVEIIQLCEPSGNEKLLYLFQFLRSFVSFIRIISSSPDHKG